MGLANASQSYQRYMDSLFQNVEGVYCYLDDLLIHTADEETHFQVVEKVIKILDDAGLSLSISKCEFQKTELEFLGYHVSHAGIWPLPKKVAAIPKFPELTKQKELLAFLGSINYFRGSLSKLKKPGEVPKSAAEVLAPLYQIATCKMPKSAKFFGRLAAKPNIAECIQRCQRAANSSNNFSPSKPQF